MGHDHQQSSSSGILVAVIGGGLVLAILGILVVAAAGMFWIRSARMESRTAVMAEHQAAVEQLRNAGVAEHNAVAQAQHDAAILQLKQSGLAAIPDPRLNLEVIIDRAGNASSGGQVITLDALRTKLVQLKDETSNAFSVQINAHAECPIKLVIPVLMVCEEVGDIEFHVAASSGLDSSIGEGAGK